MEWTAENTRGKSAADLLRIQLEEWLFDDDALLEAYDPDKVDACLEWVADQFKSNTEHTAVAAIWHDDVFRKARDYFVDGHAKEASAPPSPAAKPKRKEKVYRFTASKNPAPHPCDPTQKPVEDSQTDLFAEAR